MMKLLSFLVLAVAVACTTSFSSVTLIQQKASERRRHRPRRVLLLHARLSDERRKQLGVGDDEDEYDLGVALDTNTDPFITKVVAGSLIVVVFALLVVGVIVPSLTDYSEEGLCNPILTQGRC
jgi:hypothetical protein